MKVDWNDVKEDYKRKDDEIESLKQQLTTAQQEATAYRTSLENLEASLPKVRADAGWEEFDFKTVIENYEDLASEIEPITGARDNHFDTIMSFIEKYKEVTHFNCEHMFIRYGDQKVRRCHKCGKLEAGNEYS